MVVGVLPLAIDLQLYVCNVFQVPPYHMIMEITMHPTNAMITISQGLDWYHARGEGGDGGLHVMMRTPPDDLLTKVYPYCVEV